ncbi:hypothetical protein CON32_23560 [Bacillus cereus]|nr:hypothetical protein CON32_23560 [Bacillus cereus]
MNLDIFTQNVLDFIQQKKTNFNVYNINNTTNLINEKIINSFELIELIIFLENQCDRELPIENFKPDNVKTIEALYNSFYL